MVDQLQGGQRRDRQFLRDEDGAIPAAALEADGRRNLDGRQNGGSPGLCGRGNQREEEEFAAPTAVQAVAMIKR